MEAWKITCWCLSIFLISGCIKEDPLNQPYSSYKPQQINDGLIITDPEQESVDPVLLDAAYKEVYNREDLWPLRSMLVFRNGNLIAESYLKDANDLTNRQLIWSCTKQVVGLLAGVALEQDVFGSIDDPISMYFDTELVNHPDKSSITLRNLLTMQSGIDYNNDGASGQTDQLLRQIPDNLVDFVLSRPFHAETGTKFYYKDGDPHLMTALMQKVVGVPADEWAEDALFSSIGFQNYNWVRYKDGTTHGGYGIETTPRELAKIALLVANDGVHNGQQLVSTSWITQMTSKQVETGYDYDFGYQWWIDPGRNIHFMWGHGGQFAFIVPDYNLLVVMTSIPNTQGDYQISADEALTVVDKIINACQ